MVKVKVRHLHKIKGRWYWIPSKTARALGFQSIPLGPDLRLATPEAEKLNAKLDRERTKAFVPSAPTGSVAALIVRYLTSVQHEELKPATQTSYRQILERIRERAGHLLVADIDRPDMIETYEQLRAKHGDASAAAMMRVWRLLLSHAVDLGWRIDNPAKAMRLRAAAPRTQRWTEEQVLDFVKAADKAGYPSLGLAVDIAYDIGQRQTDILALQWGQWNGASFSIRQSKTGQPVDVPVFRPELAQRLNAMRDRVCESAKPSTMVLVCETTRRPWKTDHFKHAFAEIRQVAGLPDELQFRDLRRTAGTEWGDAGATDDELRGGGGWKSRNVVARYVVPTGKQAASAQSKRAAARAAKKAQDGNG